MVAVSIKQIENFSTSGVLKLIPSVAKQVNMNEANIGYQENDSVVLGSQKDFIFKSLAGNKFLARCTFEEVRTPTPEEPFLFDVYYFDEYAVAARDSLNKIGNRPVYAIFKDALIVRYVGRDPKHANYSLNIRKNDDSNPSVLLVCENKAPENKTAADKENKAIGQKVYGNENDGDVIYESLQKIAHNTRQNVFVIVKEVRKQPSVLLNGSTHTILILIDSSCLDKDAERLDFFLHIFFNSDRDYFPDKVEEGDILRLRNVLGEKYKKDDLEAIHGKIYSSNAIVKFKQEEKNHDITPITTNHNYVLTEQDKVLVRNMRNLWKSNNFGSDQLNTTFAKDMRIEEITSESVFNLCCMVKFVRPMSNTNYVLLRVTDGTNLNVYTNLIESMENATREMLSQAENVVLGAEEIDITVFTPAAAEQAKLLQDGDFVLLKNVNCVPEDQDTEGVQEYFSFRMENDDSRIENLIVHSCRPRAILKRLKEKETPESGAGENNLHQKESHSAVLPSIDKATTNSDVGHQIGSKSVRKSFQLSRNDTNSSGDENATLGEDNGKSSATFRVDGECNNESHNINSDDTIGQDEPYAAMRENIELEESSVLSEETLSVIGNAVDGTEPQVEGTENENPRKKEAAMAKSTVTSEDNSVEILSEEIPESDSPDLFAAKSSKINRTSDRSAACSEKAVVPVNSDELVVIDSEQLVSTSQEPAVNHKSVVANTEETIYVHSEDPVVSHTLEPEGVSSEDAIVNSEDLVDAHSKNQAPAISGEPIVKLNGRVLVPTNDVSSSSEALSTSPSKTCVNGVDKQREAVKTNKRKGSDDLETTISLKKCRYAPKYLVTEVFPHRNTTLTEFVARSRPGEKCQTLGILKEISVSTAVCESKGRKCEYFFRNLVWGKCLVCKKELHSYALRKMYDVNHLMKCARGSGRLNCIDPGCAKTNKESLMPFIKMEFLFEDLFNTKEFIVQLIGPEAEKFLGVLASFKWIVTEPPEPNLARVIDALPIRKSNELLQFCLENVKNGDGSTALQMCDTRAKVY